MIAVKDFYNGKAIRHQLKRAINNDYEYFEDAIIDVMKEYARKACKEQREICAEQHLTKLTSTGISSNVSAVLNAPEPELK